MADTHATRRFESGAIRRLLNPSSVAVIGASSTPGALGTSAIANLDRMGFAGALHLVNPNREKLGDRPCLKSVDDLPPGVDVAILAIPRAAVVETVRALARRGVGAAIIFSSGFAEGGDQGRRDQQEIARIAAEHGMVIEGPNCLGLVNYVDRVALTFVETPAAALGNAPGVAIVSQSGAMAAVLSVMLSSRELGISYSISTGNEAVSGVEDYVGYLLDDPHTRVIGMIVEQFRRPGAFLELAESARARGKRIVLLHPGRSSAARESAATHTGALAGDHAIMSLQVARHGVLLAETLEELGDLVEIAVRCETPPSGGTAILTESGAFKALALDLGDREGLALPSLHNENAPALRAAMPEFVPVSNPVDLTAQALVDPDLYRRALSALLDDERFGSIVFCIIQTDAATSNLKFPPILAALEALKPRKAVIFAGLDEGAAVPPHYIAGLRACGVPYFRSPERALRAVARFGEWSSIERPAKLVERSSLAAPLPRGVVTEYRAKQWLAPLGIPFPQGRFVTSLDQAQVAAAELGFPLVLKAQSSGLSHKSDAGGVLLNLKDPAQLAEGWTRLHANIAASLPGLALDGVLVEKMGKPGVEFIVGARNDPDWGSVIVAGFGGVQAELIKDVRLLPADLSLEAIARELDELKGAALLRGFRGSPALDVPALASIIACVGRLMRSQPAIREIDLNPVIAYRAGEGALALDALMLVEDQASR